ncbi:flavodoxin domain-containing protein [Streptomyces sp. MST-110588]|uniref:flavodoxin domain-containing protein n=1 Tax=Streptomyces sp. MST-110588 TaxID=2833628 RepID=UPI001F5E1977|nr:flavodoxin domain-containing protein [Streptomyces sp. MST-110588]UNO43355.1 flavodoxin domain-containing protein [Streptomyces sp. MST-110588]
MRVYVGYAGEHGSTRGIAERLAATLTQQGHRADVTDLADERTGAPEHDACVLGSAIHNGRWLPPAAEYLRRYTPELARRPLWLFSVGLARILGDWFARRSRSPAPLPALRDLLAPVDHHLFAGAFERDHTSVFGHLVFRSLGGHYGDHRDWREIDAWATDIARHLLPAPSQEAHHRSVPFPGRQAPAGSGTEGEGRGAR